MSFKDVYKKVTVARKAIVETGQSSGAIDCPICKVEEALQFSVAKSNGHVYAKCKTKDCVAWME